MAITAWSAKVVDQLDLLLGEWAAPRARQTMKTPIGCPSRSSGTPSMVRIAAERLRIAHRVFGIGQHVRNMDGLAAPAHVRPTAVRGLAAIGCAVEDTRSSSGEKP